MREQALSSKNNYKELNNIELIKLIQNHDEEAKEYFVIKNMGLVYSCVQKFIHFRTNKDDLIQIGCVGLMKALNQFDLSRDVQFSTYAIPIIFGEIRRYFRDDGNIRISRSIKENYSRICQQKDQFIQLFGYEPNYEQLAHECNCTIEEVYTAFDAHQYMSSMDEEIVDSDGRMITLNDRLASPMEDEIMRMTLNREINTLERKEQLVIYFRYSLGYKQNEIAKRLNCTQVQVSRMEKQILNKLKQKME